MTRRAWAPRVLFVLAILSLYIWFPRKKIPEYPSIAAAEHALPQHDLSLPFPEGQDGRYVRFATQVHSLGYNNVLQEILVLTHLSYLSNRAYVFRDFKWPDAHTPFRDDAGAKLSPRVPLSAFLSGPPAGGPWGVNETAPRAITDAWWEIVCPPERRVLVSSMAMKARFDDAKVDGLRLMERWAQLLRDMQENCVEIISGLPTDVDQTFDFWLFGERRVLTLWPSLSTSPTIKQLRPSKSVENAVSRNIQLLTTPSASNDENRIPGLIAVHLRRGDYEDHCKHLLKYNSTFQGWNQLPHLHQEPKPQGMSREEWHMRKCWPSFKDIAERLGSARKAYPGLERVFLLTNGDQEWLSELGRALRLEGWKAIVSSLDLDLTWHDIGLGPAVDMEIARRADVFIGNGWSSLSSNIVLFRLSSGKSPKSTSTW